MAAEGSVVALTIDSLSDVVEGTSTGVGTSEIDTTSTEHQLRNRCQSAEEQSPKVKGRFFCAQNLQIVSFARRRVPGV